MPWYRNGAVSVANNSASVSGAGTAWVANAAAGQAILLGGIPYEIQAVTADGAITLASPYQGAALTGASYAILPTQDYIRSLAAQVAALINNFTSIQDGAGAGKFGAGTAAAPGLAFSGDTDTGLYNESANVLALATGGAKRAALSSAGLALEVPVNEKAGAAIASAATINLTAATGNRVHVTGTTTINAVTLGAGMRRTVVFDGSLQLTHGTNLRCPGGNPIVTQAGDRAVFGSADGTVVYVDSYTRADGSSLGGQGSDADQCPRNRDLGTGAYIDIPRLPAASGAGFATGITAGTPQSVLIGVPGLRSDGFVLSVSFSIYLPAGISVQVQPSADDQARVTYRSDSGTVTLGPHIVYILAERRFSE